MANKRLLEIYHRNGMRYLRLNLKRSEPYKPTPVVKPGWKMPEYPETKCQYCRKMVRPQAYNDCGTIHLSVGCCDSLIEEIDWPFTEDYIHNVVENLEALGFEFIWG